jgi:3-oxoacyl-[acyl-carrier protein] reductase
VNTERIAANPSTAHYAAAKAALAILMRTVAVEEGPNGIRANMVCPGFIDSGNYSDEFREKAVAEIPLRRIGEPDDVAKPVCWLLTDEASYVTGAIINAGGGLWV